MDEINGYRCSCPPGRSGLRCQEGRWGMPLARPRSGWGVRGSLLSMCPTSPAHSDRVREVLLVAGRALPSRELVGGGLQQLPLPGRPPRLQQGVGSVHLPCALPLPCGSAASAPQACSPHHSPPTLLLTRGGCGGRETGEPGPGRRGPPCCAGLLHRGALAVGGALFTAPWGPGGRGRSAHGLMTNGVLLPTWCRPGLPVGPVRVPPGVVRPEALPAGWPAGCPERPVPAGAAVPGEGPGPVSAATLRGLGGM